MTKKLVLPQLTAVTKACISRVEDTIRAISYCGRIREARDMPV